MKPGRIVNANVYTAIVYKVDKSTGELSFLKYRNIGKDNGAMRRFENFLLRDHPGSEYINYYDPVTKKFQFRTKLV